MSAKSDVTFWSTPASQSSHLIYSSPFSLLFSSFFRLFPDKGLVIPDGGVHIVGGDNGDAFIAFATDEDARRAMQMTGRELHGKPVQ